MRIGVYVLGLIMPAALLAQSTAGGLTNYPEQAKAESFRETVFGITIDDPYRWMEDAARKPDLARWMQASSRHTRDQLAALPGYAGLLADITAASRSAPGVREVKTAGGRLFFERMDPSQDRSVLVVREADGNTRVLLDPTRGRPRPASIGTYQPSPDGRMVAVQLSEGGSEIGAGYILDVASGRQLDDVLAPMWSDTPYWLDAKTLVYARLAATEGRKSSEDVTVYRHIIGRPSIADEPLLGSLAPASGVSVTPLEAAAPAANAVSGWTIAAIGQARADTRIAVAPTASILAGKPRWTALIDYADRVSRGAIYGGTLYYVTSRSLPDGEVRSLSLTTPMLRTSKRIYGGSGIVIGDLIAADDGLYFTSVRPEGSSRLMYQAYGAVAPTEVPLPFAGALSNLEAGEGGSPAVVAATGWLHETQFFGLKNGKATSLGLGNPDDPRITGEARVIEESATSRDGTKVPLTILAPPANFAGPKPTILEAYSSYGSVASPFYGPVTLTWVRRGGVYASCHARGGGEQGRAWHEAGRGANKPRGQEDVVACAERLIALGLASPNTLGGWGTSAGGTIVPPAALARPDLFRAVTASVSLVNTTALARSENGAMQFAEFGDPNTAEGFRALAAQDSTLLLPRARGGPDFLFTVGLNDHRVPFWNSAKLAAAMRAQWSNSHLALLRVDDDAGHGIGSGRDQTLALRADMFAFFLNRFGAPGFAN